MKVTIGSNVFADSSGVLVAGDEEQITLEVGDSDGQALLSMNIYDESGSLVGKLKRNSWVHNQDRFDITTTPRSLELVEKPEGATLIRVEVTSRTKITVDKGDFYTRTGVRILITPDELNIGGTILQGNLFRNNGAHIVLQG